jgi:flagellar hook-associated protein 3 FlgL
MALVSMGDLAQSFLLRRQTLVAKLNIQTLSTEMTMGQVADTGAHVSGDLSPISGLDASLARLNSFAIVTREATLFASTMQTTLGAIDDFSADLSSSLLAVSTSGVGAQIDAVGAQARQKLDTAVLLYNTKVGDRVLFSGMKSDGAALIDSESLLAAVETVTTGALSALDIETAVTDWFNDPAGFDALAYTGGAPRANVAIAAGEEVALNVTAIDPGVKATLKGLVLGALLDRGALAGLTSGRQDLAKRAGLTLINGQTDRSALQARVGLVEAQLDAAALRNDNEKSALQIARNGIVAADPYETASKLQESQSQLELIYAITARMSRLSLMDYMR